MVIGREKNDNIKDIEIIPHVTDILSFEYRFCIMENIPARGINKLIIVKKK
jgi:hypothetical protein